MHKRHTVVSFVGLSHPIQRKCVVVTSNQTNANRFSGIKSEKPKQFAVTHWHNNNNIPVVRFICLFIWFLRFAFGIFFSVSQCFCFNFTQSRVLWVCALNDSLVLIDAIQWNRTKKIINGETFHRCGVGLFNKPHTHATNEFPWEIRQRKWNGKGSATEVNVELIKRACLCECLYGVTHCLHRLRQKLYNTSGKHCLTTQQPRKKPTNHAHDKIIK